MEIHFSQVRLHLGFDHHGFLFLAMDTSCIPGVVQCPSILVEDNPPYKGSNVVSRLGLFLQLIMPEFQGKSQRLSRTSELSLTSPANFNDAGNVFCANALLKQADSQCSPPD